MSVQCPQCGQAVADDFGVTVCSHCQAPLFIDLNGDVQLSAAPTEFATESVVEQADLPELELPYEPINELPQEQVVGAIAYTVVIEGIDTKELRTQVQEALSDPKFQWSEAELMKQVKMGSLTLKNLSPVKASVLISRLKELSLKLSWTQQIFS